MWSQFAEHIHSWPTCFYYLNLYAYGPCFASLVQIPNQWELVVLLEVLDHIHILRLALYIYMWSVVSHSLGSSTHGLRPWALCKYMSVWLVDCMVGADHKSMGTFSVARSPWSYSHILCSTYWLGAICNPQFAEHIQSWPTSFYHLNLFAYGPCFISRVQIPNC